GAEAYRERLRNSRPYLGDLLDRAAEGVNLAQDEGRRRFLGKMMEGAAPIPAGAAGDAVGGRIGHKGRVTEEVVRTAIRKAAVQRKTELTERELPSFGALKNAEKGLIWGLIHDNGAAMEALRSLDTEDLTPLLSCEVFEVARGLHDEPEG